jgi:putative N6-adenine-specific DNA methylase
VTTRYRVFVAVTPGLEPLLEQELAELELPDRPTTVTGGAELACDRRGLWQVALRSRLAESVRVRLGRPFRAVSFDQLRDTLCRLPWSAYLARGLRPEVRVVCRRSRLYHSGAVAERIEAVLEERLGPASDTAGRPPPRVYARLERDLVQISIDASGELLHRRGYRTHVGEAPLRETLASACLRAAGLNEKPPHALWDPFCGAGTIVLEALCTAAGLPAGASRRFAFESWPTHDAEAYGALLQRLPEGEPPALAAYGSDIDPGVLSAARENARRAGVAEHLTLLEGDFEAVAEAIPRGAAVVTNPPHGRRLAGRGLGDLHGRLGALFKKRPDLRPVHVLTGYRGFRRATGLRWRQALSFDNRGSPVQLLRLR